MGYQLKGVDHALNEALWHRLGFIFQAHNLHDSLTVLQNVLMGLQVHGLPDPKTQDVAARHALSLCRDDDLCAH